MKYLLACLVFFSSCSFSWYEVPGYVNPKLYGISGSLIENAGLKKSNIEIVWQPKKRVFGATFYSLIDHSDSISIPNGKFFVSGCNRVVHGDILGPQFIINKYDVTKLARLFRVCNGEIVVNIVDNVGQYGTYRIDGHDKMRFKELK